MKPSAIEILLDTVNRIEDKKAVGVFNAECVFSSPHDGSHGGFLIEYDQDSPPYL